MGSAAFGGEDESHPRTSNGKSYKLPTTILDGCGAVNHALIPRKLRSAIKKRGRESVASPLLISRKDGAKKSKRNKKQRHITKDEEEVAETLYALAGMFSDANKVDQKKIEHEKQEIKSSAIVEEEGISINAVQDTCLTLQVENRKINSKVTLGAVCPSNVLNSTAEEIISQTLEARQPELFFSSKQVATPNASGDQSDLTPCSTSRPLVSILGMNQNGEQEIHLDQVAASGFQYGKNEFKDLSPSPNFSATRATSSEMHKSCPVYDLFPLNASNSSFASHELINSRLSSARIRLFEGMIFPSQPHAVENKISAEKHTRVATESNRSWKRCSAHVYISRLIKVLQISDRKDGLPVKPTQHPTCRGAKLQSRVSINDQMLRINGGNGDTYFSGIDVVAAKKDSSETRDQQMVSEASAKQKYDFLSLETGLCVLDIGEGANGAGCFLEPPKQYHTPCMQSQNQSTMLCSLPRNGYSLSSHSHNPASAAQQVQLSPYHSSGFTGRTGQQMQSQQQKWAAQLQMHYNTGGGGSAPRLPDWRNGAVVNHAHSLFPHLHAALGSKYQQLSPSQQQVMTMKRRHNLPSGFERNGAVFHPENMAQLQPSCNRHL